MSEIIPEYAIARKEICKICEYFTEFNRCSVCGCFMDLKVLIPTADCPKNKWVEIK